MHTHKELPLSHPSIVFPYIYLTALRAPSKTFMTIWLNQHRQIISFLSFLFSFFFFSFNVNKGIWVHGFNRCWEQSFGSVVSWLDEQMQTWLPLCESSLLTTVTKIQSEVFLPVYIQSRTLTAGTWIWTSNSTTTCFTKHHSVVLFFLDICLY